MMSSQEFNIKKEFEQAKQELRKIHQGNTSKEVIDAIIDKVSRNSK